MDGAFYQACRVTDCYRPQMRSDETPVCMAEVVLRVVRSRWALTIIKVIADGGPIHFSAIGRRIPNISAKVLADQLRNLHQAAVLQRIGTDDRQEVYYQLTNRGQELKLALDDLNSLAQRWPRL